VTRDDRIALACFVFGGIFAGGNVIAVRFSVRELEPLWGAGFRFLAAAVLLFAIVGVMRLELPRGRALAGAALYGTLNFAAAFALAYYGLTHIHGGLGSTLLALVPLTTLALAVVQRQESFRMSALIGSLVALAGVGFISGPALKEAPTLAFIALLGGVVCFAEATVLVRRLPKMHPVTMNAVGMGVAAVLLIAGSLVAGEAQVLPERTATWLALAYVVPVGSIVVFVLFIVLLRYWSASRVAYVDVLIPFVAVGLSWWLDDEPITRGLLIGGGLILVGVYLGALRGVETQPEQDAVTASS
jgi:drug/metabolite transporter (DMT)-like permease